MKLFYRHAVNSTELRHSRDPKRFMKHVMSLVFRKIYEHMEKEGMDIGLRNFKLEVIDVKELDEVMVCISTTDTKFSGDSRKIFKVDNSVEITSLSNIPILNYNVLECYDKFISEINENNLIDAEYLFSVISNRDTYFDNAAIVWEVMT